MELKDTSLLARQELKKPEKLVSALYVITSFFDDREPIKWKLRTLASEFITLSMSFKERQITTLGARNIVLEIIEFLLIAKNVGLVSTENHNLIQGELVKYINTLDYPVNISDFLNIESPRPEANEMPRNHMIKDRSEYKLTGKGQLQRTDQKEKSLKKFGAVSVKKNSRQNSIITILKRKKEIMIKDISPIISGCSEKTIQRELLAMVQAGILRKVGEKRWSRYSLA